MTSPNYKPTDAGVRTRRAGQTSWEKFVRLNMKGAGEDWDYMDRIGPKMFVGRYNFGKCDTITHDDTKTLFGDDDDRTRMDMRIHALGEKLRYEEINYDINLKHHAYIVTVTPDKIECNCIYCGSTMSSCDNIRPEKIPWDEPWEKPRCANERELDAMRIEPFKKDTLRYLDYIDTYTALGRIRCGTCPEGGQHECMIHYPYGEYYNKYPKFSNCIFCGEEWAGAPEGFWEAKEPNITFESVVQQHEKDKVAGLY